LLKSHHWKKTNALPSRSPTTSHDGKGSDQSKKVWGHHAFKGVNFVIDFTIPTTAVFVYISSSAHMLNA